MKSFHSESLIQVACSPYAIDPGIAKLIRWNSNLIYDCGDRILRLTHFSIRSKSDIQAELDWVRYLSRAGLEVVKIIESNRGMLFEEITSTDRENPFIVVCFEKIEGRKITREKWNGQHFQKLGRLAGTLHRVGNLYQEPPHLLYKNWDEIVEHRFCQYLPDDERVLTKLHSQLVRGIRNIPKGQDNYGMIHYDIHIGNYLLDKKDTIVLFDFEMCCNSWYINDIAAILYYALHFPATRKKGDFESEFMYHFWQGYEKEYHLRAIEKSYFPILLLYRDLMVYGYLFKIWANQELTSNQANYKAMIAQSIALRRGKLGL